VIQQPHEYQLCTKQSLVKREGVSVATKVLFMSFFSFSFSPNENSAQHTHRRNLIQKALNGSHSPSRLGPHTSSVLLAELDTSVCTATNGNEESETPDAGDNDADG
jgi:hypothetical protein